MKAYRYGSVLFTLLTCIHLIQKMLSSELLHCALRIVAYPDRNAPWMLVIFVFRTFIIIFFAFLFSFSRSCLNSS